MRNTEKTREANTILDFLDTHKLVTQNIANVVVYAMAYREALRNFNKIISKNGYTAEEGEKARAALNRTHKKLLHATSKII